MDLGHHATAKPLDEVLWDKMLNLLLSMMEKNMEIKMPMYE